MNATANGGASFTDTAAKLLAEFQIKAKETVRSGTGGGQLSLLEGLKVKLPSEKGNAVPLPKLCTLNVIDAQKAELLVVDEAFVKAVMSAVQSAQKNLTVHLMGTTKLAVSFPKATAESKAAAQEQVKRLAQSLKNDLRELRRKDINKFRQSCKDKDAIHRFENEIQKEFDAQVKAIDSFCATIAKSK